MKDLTGSVFGYLTVLDGSDRRNSEGRRMWKCKCVCGNIVYKDTKALTTGSVKSCGCKRKELHNQSSLVTKHGMSHSRLYKIWSAMRNRCADSNTEAYKHYGGRGISVTKEWEDFSCFMKWAYSSGYSDELTIDRIDVDGNYEPANCRWATRKEQSNNKRTCRYVTYNGETHTISEWSDLTGFNKTLIRERLNNGWTPEEALTIPPVPGGLVRHDGIK